MAEDPVDHLLQAGITAARQGKIEDARRLLLEVIARDEENETAWLWLSGVVDGHDDKRICLENVLALNPENQAARRGLAKLAGAVAETVSGPGSSPSDQQPARRDEFSVARYETEQYLIHRELPPISPAAAVLYPERRVQQWFEGSEDEPAATPVIAFQERSEYDDVWEKEIDICAFCANPVDVEAKSCARCRRKLTSSHYRYPQASSDSMIYVVLLLGVGQLYFIRALLDVIGRLPWYVVAWHGLLFLILFAFAAGAYFRQAWAYFGSLLFLIVSIGVMLIEMLGGPALSSATEPASGAGFFLAMAEQPFLKLAEPVLTFMPTMQFIGMILAQLYGILKVYPDFARDEIRLLARVDKGLGDATQFYAAGKECARNEMWASAVLCWQRAAALDPTRSHYQQVLADAYARLGFYERSVDTYRSASRLSRDPETRRQLKRAMATLEQRLQPQR